MKNLLPIPKLAVSVLYTTLITGYVFAQSSLKPCPASTSPEQCEFSRLYDLSRELHAVQNGGTDYSRQFTLQRDILFRTDFISDDLTTMLDGSKQEMYVFTPDYAGRIDLSKDAEGNRVCTADSLRSGGRSIYNLEIPYFPDDPIKQKGYYRLTLYAYFNEKTKACRVVIDTPEFHSESAAATPPKGKKIPLPLEKMFWDRKAKHNFSADAKAALLNDIAAQIKMMPAEKKEGDIWVLCPGMGCYRTISFQQATDFNKNRSLALEHSKALAEEYGLFGKTISREELESHFSKSNQPASPRTEIDHMDPGYTRDNEHVYVYGKIVNDADPKSFQRIGRTPYFKDVNHVYVGIKIIPEADAGTFSPLHPDDFYGYIGRDAKHVFFNGTEIQGADPKNVKELTGTYWISNQTVYLGDKPIGLADARTFKADGTNIQAPPINGFLDEKAFTAEDKNHYFLNDRVFNKSECRIVGELVLACKNFIVDEGPQYSQIDSDSLRYLGRLSNGGCGGVAVHSGVYQDKNGVYAVSYNGQIKKFNFIPEKNYDALDSGLEARLCGGFPNPKALTPDHY